MSKLSGSGRLVKRLFVFANFCILWFGLATIALGAVLQFAYVDLNFVTDSETITGAVLVIGVGVAISILAFLGMAAGLYEVWKLGAFYAVYMSGLVILGLALAMFSLVDKEGISQRARDTFFTDISNYTRDGDSEYNLKVNQLVDFFQSEGQCCGLNGPEDWLHENLEYCIDNLGLPDTCRCNYSMYLYECMNITIPVSAYDEYPFSSWNKGCNESIDFVVSSSVEIIIVMLFPLSVCEVMMLCCSCCLCKFLRDHNSHVFERKVANYRPLNGYVYERAAVNYHPPINRSYHDNTATNSCTQKQVVAPSPPSNSETDVLVVHAFVYISDDVTSSDP